MSIVLWASFEAPVGIIAACIPCLRAAFFERSRAHGAHHRRLGSGGKETGKLSWHGAKRGESNSTRAQPGSGNALGCGPRTMSTKIVANESDEDFRVPEKGASSVRRGRIQRKAKVDIELVGVGGKQLNGSRIGNGSSI
jgi:hypothetical protein